MAKAEMKASLMLAEGQWERSRCRSETAYILAALWRRPTFVRLTFCRRSTCMQNGGTNVSVLPECAGRWCDADGLVVQHRRQFCAIAQRCRVTAYPSRRPLAYSNAVLYGMHEDRAASLIRDVVVQRG